jgi:lysophospholipase L1-like esterase
MRLTLALVIAIAVAAAVYASARRDRPAAAEMGAVTLVGDSLNVGVEPYLRDELRGWRIDAHDLVGRSSADGIEQLRELGLAVAAVLVVSLGTNDAEGSEGEFRRLVDRALELAGPNRCVVWATIVRDGAPRSAFDDVLRDASSSHGNLRLVDWGELVARDRDLLTSDGVHATPDGYARRADETARVVRDCG